MVFIADWWSNSKLYVYVDPEIRKKYLGKEHTLLMMNHTYDVDWLIGWMLTEKVGVLGNCKAYAKKVISYIPVIGWSWKFAEFVFLERSFEKDKEIIGTQINEIFDYPDPVWVCVSFLHHILLLFFFSFDKNLEGNTIYTLYVCIARNVLICCDNFFFGDSCC